MRGARATEWAYLAEPYALPAYELVFDQLGVDADARLLDIACGSGLAASMTARRGARPFELSPPAMSQAAWNRATRGMSSRTC
jgi:cyclopropane fatty-acyl-phospholipid synthase-like methyltransferase